MQARKFIFLIALLSPSTLFAADTPTSCPYSAKELSAALNDAFKDGKVGFESDFGTGKSLSCRYEGKEMSLIVNQTAMKDPSQTKGWDARLAGKKLTLANDPDMAIQQTDQGDNTSPNLHYARQGVIVELRVMRIGKQHPQFDHIQKKLPSLRRLP